MPLKIFLIFFLIIYKMVDNLYKKILLSDRLALSKAITLIESTKLKDRSKSEKLIKKLYKNQVNH